MSSLAPAREAADHRADPAQPPERGRLPALSSNLLIGTGVAVGLVAFALVAAGGTALAPNTWAEMGLTVVAAAMAVAVLLVGGPGRRWGAVTVLLFAALTALTFASLAWSVQPAGSWVEANRTLSYFAAFAGAAAAARIAPRRWPALVGGVATAATILCAYALLVKVFPATFDPTNQLGRLRAPFEYWNATGLIAAMGIPCLVWAGARREGGVVLRALSVSAIALLVISLALSESRGALLAVVIALAGWFALVPLRLRAALVLALGSAGGAVTAAWAANNRDLTSDYYTLHDRVVGGQQFGVVLVVLLAVMVLAGAVTAVAMARTTVSPRARRRIGVVLVVALALVPVAGVGALAASSRGLTGQLSHAWDSLTNQHSVVYNTPGRLAQLGSSRPRYWSDGLKVGEHALLAGTGAGGFDVARSRYTSDVGVVGHAHSFLVETFADLGLIGVAVSLALLVAWALAVRRIWPAGDRGAESAGLLTLLAVTVAFGIQSLIDWTWFIPGVTVTAMACAGWLAGRGPLADPVGTVKTRRRLLDAPGRAALALGVVTVTVLAAWMIWQPLRSSDADAAAVNAMLKGDQGAAVADARSAAAADPLSVEPLSTLAAIYIAQGRLEAAHRELADATALQPSNPVTWAALAQFDLQHQRLAEARRATARARMLDPGATGRLTG